MSLKECYEFDTGEELLEICNRETLKISEVMRRSEKENTGFSFEKLDAQMYKSYEVMKASVIRGQKEKLFTMGGLIGGEGKLMAQSLGSHCDLMGTLSTKASAYAMGVLEVNASMGVIVAAPTAGASGILPGVLVALEEERGLKKEEILSFLYNAGAIGMLIMKNATVSGAVGGCQAETGSATSMAASAICEVLGGTPQMCFHAASFALQNVMGLICDPILGLVESPCQKRNAMGAVNALLSAQMALLGMKSPVSLQRTIKAMHKVGLSLPYECKETALGGIAIEYVKEREEKR